MDGQYPQMVRGCSHRASIAAGLIVAGKIKICLAARNLLVGTGQWSPCFNIWMGGQYFHSRGPAALRVAAVVPVKSRGTD